MGTDLFSYKKIIITLTIIILLFSIFPQTLSGTQKHTIYGNLSYSNGETINQSIKITILNTENGNKTIVSSDNQGFFSTEINAEIGDLIWFNTTIDDVEGSNSIIITNSSSQQCDIIIPKILPPVADFNFNPTQPLINQSIQFFDNSQSENEIISWFWDFDDESSSISQNPTYRYDKPGIYAVKLIVVDNYGNKDEYCENIVVYDLGFAPNANFSYEFSSDTINDTVSFFDDSFDIDGNITSWFWDFGDGSFSWDKNPLKKYNLSGEYEVLLKIMDDNNLTDIVSKVIDIQNNDSSFLEADFSYDLERSKEKTRVYFFDNSKTSTNINVSWFWDFDDGGISSEQNPVHDYYEPGIYDVKLKIKNRWGLEDEIQNSIKIPHYNEEIIRISPVANQDFKTYIIWKGESVNASVLVKNMDFNPGESVSIFNSENGKWQEYTYFSNNNAMDFVISPWTMIKLDCRSPKEFWMLNLNQSDYTKESVDLKNNYQPSDKSGNPGYNYIIWMEDITIHVSELADFIDLEDSWFISKYNEEENRWISYIQGIGLEGTILDFIIQKNDIICIRVSENKNLVFNNIGIE